jgi:NTE family protein
LLFPAVKLFNSWHGDGGVRLTTPLAPAIHLGARRIIAVSTRYNRSDAEAALPQIEGYPPPAQIGGILLNAIFLDQLDHDAYQLERTNRLVANLAEPYREGLRHIDLLVLRPSTDLGRLATEYESRLPRGFRFLIRGLGTRETRNSDLLSVLLFQEDYIRRVIAIGEEDVHRQRDAVLALVE